MILNGKKLKNIPFTDPRGHCGESGQLHISTDTKGRSFLVKSNPADVTNEFVVHRLAQIIGVPTSDAALIDNRGFIEVGIVYEKDFKRASIDDFIGDAKYPDDSPYLADFVSFLALRDLVAMGDNHQLAFARNHLISYDYADSFFLSDSTYGVMCLLNDLSIPISAFSNNILIRHELESMLRILQRPKTDFLVDAYCDTLFSFMDADLTPILNDLKAVFPAVVPAFYEACFDIMRDAIDELAE